MKKKLDPEIFREAAKIVKNGKSDFACNGIIHVTKKIGENPYLAYFKKWFCPEDADEWRSWWGSPYSKENQECRIIALLICADILERENIKK